MRLSSEPFNLKTKDPYVHLTNNAVQKNHAQYGKANSGNQMSFGEFEVE